MSELIRTFTITVGKVYNDGVECRHPKVDLIDSTAAVSCIDRKKGIYRVQLGPNDSSSSLAFEVKCDDADCDTCETQTIVKRFCDSVEDCEVDEFCDAQGFCSSVLGPQFGENGEIISDGQECTPDVPCPGNKICQNGKCVCPIGTFEDGDYCSDCRTALDCELCEVCESNGEYKECRAKDCNCNSVGECVECTNSGHCGQNEVCNEGNECECAPGSIRIGAVCTAIECGDDGECEDCQLCNGIICIPIQCPPGKTLQVVDGICSCVTTCEDCEPEVVCGGPCDTGLDCGEGCGCEDQKCVKCSDVGCGACTGALGCICNDDTCEPETCNNVTCVTPSDCDLGCTCESGLCEACGNYSAGDCTKPGCTPIGGICGPDPNGPTDPGGECEDSLTITKNSDCSITGEIIKTSCCSCSPITIDGFISKVGTVGSNKRVDFTVELRKGLYDADDPLANPLLNAVHPEIAENEQPLSGTISITVVTQYSVTSAGRPVGLTTDAAITHTLPIGGKTSVTFLNIPIYSVGFSITNGTEVKTVTKTTVDVIHSGALVCENLCVYDSGTHVGTFVFDDNGDFTIKSDAVGTTVYSDICRKPFAKWTKSVDTEFDEQPFRKIYPNEVGGVYTDTVTPADGSESCFNYQFESDCNCGDPATEYIVFCDPSTFPKPELSNCNKTAVIQIDAACAANWDKPYDLYLNEVKADSFLLNEAYENTLTSETAITSITLKLRCDTEGQCDITHTYDADELESDPDILCNGETYTATWAEEGLTKVEYGFSAESLLTTVTPVDGTAVITSLESDVVYYYKLTYTACVSAVGSFTESCPQASQPLVECNSDGTFTISNMEDGGIYTLSDFEVGGSETTAETIIPSFGEYIISAEEAQTAKTLTYEVSGFSGEITIPAYSNSDCCNIVYSYWTNGLELHVVIHDASFPVEVLVSDVLPQTASTADQELTFTLPSAGSYTIRPICEDFPECYVDVPITVEDCDIEVELMASSIGCNYIATSSVSECPCDTGYVTIDQIVVTNNPGGIVDSEDPYHSDYVTLTYRLVVSIPNADATVNGISDLTISLPGEIDGGHDAVTQVGEFFTGWSNFDGFKCYDGEYPCDNCAYGNLTINLILEDGCEYSTYFILYLCRGGERIYSPDYSNSANLAPSNSKSPRFDWLVNTALVKTEYQIGISPTSALSVEEGSIEPGDTVLVNTGCGCESSASTTECLASEITDIELTELNSHVSFTLDTCYLDDIVSVNLYDCGNNLIDTVTTLGTNLADGHTFELGSQLCIGTAKLTYAFFGSECVGEVEFDVPELSSESSSASSSISLSISSSSSSSPSSSLSSSISPSSSASSSISPSSSISSSVSPSQSISSSVSPSASISSSPSSSLSASSSISSSPSLGSSPSSSISSSISPSSSASSSISPSSSISSSPSSSISSSPSFSLSPSSSMSSSPSSSISSSISSSESSSISPSSSISSSISSSPSSSYSPSESISSSPSAGSSTSSSISSSVSPSSSRSSSKSSSPSRSISSSISPSSSRSSSPSRSRSSSRSSSLSPSFSISSSPSSSRSSSRSSSVSPSTSISRSPSSSRSSSRSSSISSSPSVPPNICDCYTGTITLASFSCYLGNCWFFASATFTRVNSACPSLLSYTESDFIMSGSLYGTVANSISGTADEIGVEFSYNVGGVPNICGDDTFTLYGIDVTGADACAFDTQFVSIAPCEGSCSPCIS